MLVYAVAWGLALLLPAGGAAPLHRWLGLRFSGAVALLCAILYMANPVLGLPVSVGAWMAVAAAGVGLGAGARRLEAAVLTHPVVLLPAGLALVMAVHGPVEYLPVSWDEFSNWLGWAKQIYVTDTHWDPAMSIGQTGYTPGWVLLMAFPDVVLGSFREVNSASIQFFMHVGVLGMAFDLLRGRLLDQGVGQRPAAVSAWLFVLAALAVEATWKLYPTLQLIEKPQIYSMAAVLLVALAAGEREADRTRLAGYFGLFLAFGYLLKMAMLTFVPAALVVGAVALAGDRPGLRRLALRFALAAAPLALAVATWRLASPETGGCMSNPFKVLTIGDGAALDRAMADAGMVAGRYFGAIAEYVAAFKPWLTVLALGGLAVAAADRRPAWTVAALAAFIAAYFGMLYIYHLLCFGYDELNSIPRFTRVPLRLVHLFGLLLPALLAARHAKFLAGLVPAGAARAVPLAATVLAVALGAVQVHAVERSLDDIATRSQQGPELVRDIALVRRDALALTELVSTLGIEGAATTLIDQNSSGLAANVARYYAITGVRGDPPFVFRVRNGHSWGEDRANQWMTSTSHVTLRNRFLAQDVLWPVRLDDWVMPLIRELAADPACPPDFARVFLVRTRDRVVPFRCVARVE